MPKRRRLRENQNISGIEFDSGFESTSHFNRIFREEFGLSPLQFRKKMSTTE